MNADQIATLAELDAIKSLIRDAVTDEDDSLVFVALAQLLGSMSGDIAERAGHEQGLMVLGAATANMSDEFNARIIDLQPDGDDG